MAERQGALLARETAAPPACPRTSALRRHEERRGRALDDRRLDDRARGPGVGHLAVLGEVEAFLLVHHVDAETHDRVESLQNTERESAAPHDRREHARGLDEDELRIAVEEAVRAGG